MFVASLVCLWSVFSAAETHSLDEPVLRVSRYYEKIRDFRADFRQVYTRVALSRTIESEGQIFVKKPGRIRFEYKKPTEKSFISDGKQLFVYEPEEKQVIIDQGVNLEELSSSLSFLWGKGRMTDAFVAKTLPPGSLGIPAGKTALELVPKKDSSYTRVVLILKDHQEVAESILFEATGNNNHFYFDNVKTNTGIDDKFFSFVPPKDVEVVRRH